LTATFVRENLRFVETYEAVLEALGDRTRRQIVRRLRAGPSSVGELAAALPVSRPAVSQHLTVLRRCGLVRYEELGTRNVYRLDPAGLSELRAWLDGFWEAALDRYAGHRPLRGGGREFATRDLPPPGLTSTPAS
jgi:DNA-binding transcriptional ArsR family regulator